MKGRLEIRKNVKLKNDSKPLLYSLKDLERRVC